MVKRRKRTTPRDELLPLPFARVSPDTPGAWSSGEGGTIEVPVDHNLEPLVSVLVDDMESRGMVERVGTDASGEPRYRLTDEGKAHTQTTEQFTVELPGFEVDCIRHLDRPSTWIVGVWSTGGREGSIRGATQVVRGRVMVWRGGLDREDQAVIARAACIAIDEREKGGAT